MNTFAPRISAQPGPLLPAVDIRIIQGLARDVWPADMNRDGRTDLVATVRNGSRLAVLIGRGDGTFAAPVISAIGGAVLTVGDVNGDGRPDVVAHDDERVFVAAGTGTAALGHVHEALEGSFFTFATVADMDNDGRRDLVIGQEGFSLHVLPGRGDFTFDSPYTFPTGAWPHGHFVVDLDGDGLRDVVVAHRYERAVMVFRNGGAFAFSPSLLPIEHSSTDVTARDLNGDGAADLVVSARGKDDDGPWDTGLVYVYLGGGDGTFAPPATYRTAPGTHSVVVGDFTRDGLVDIATANQSAWWYESMCVTGYQSVDSVSLLPGTGDGTFGPAIDFALEPIDAGGVQQFQLVVGTLNTAHLDRDGHLDLITTNGALLFNAAPRANRPPIVDAGDDQAMIHPEEVRLAGGAVDPDHHLLKVGWSERTPATPTEPGPSDQCFLLGNGPGRYTFHFNAADGHGGVSSDSTTVTWLDPVPPDWASHGVGTPGTPGSAVSIFNTNQWRVRGSGADIWGTADEFHWVHQPVRGDFEVTTRVWSVEHVNDWTKAGLMVRDGAGAGAPHASIFVTPTRTNGIVFQRRPARNGASVHTAGPQATAPYWIKLKRTGDVVSAYASPSGLRSTWTLIGRQTFAALSPTLDVGIAVTSHVKSVAAEAIVEEPLVLDGRPLWVTEDIGAVGIQGEDDYSNYPATLVMSGSGADIWGTADAFRFHSSPWTFDGSITARLRSLERTHPWAKAGVMFRETVDAGSKHVSLIVSPGHGLAMQYRSETRQASAQLAIEAGVAAPEWVRLVRNGDTFTGYASDDGTTWRTVGSITVPMSSDAFAGLAVTSHDTGTLAEAVFEGKSLTR